MHGPQAGQPTPPLVRLISEVELHLISKLRQTLQAGYAPVLVPGCDSLLHHMSRLIWLAGILKRSEGYGYLFDIQVGLNADVVVRT